MHLARGRRSFLRSPGTLASSVRERPGLQALFVASGWLLSGQETATSERTLLLRSVNGIVPAVPPLLPRTRGRTRRSVPVGQSCSPDRQRDPAGRQRKLRNCTEYERCHHIPAGEDMQSVV